MTIKTMIYIYTVKISLSECFSRRIEEHVMLFYSVLISTWAYEMYFDNKLCDTPFFPKYQFRILNTSFFPKINNNF